MSYNNEYSLGNDLNNNSVQQSVENFAQKHVGGNAMAALGLIVLLTLVIVWLVFWKAKETFNPTQSARFQDSDQFGLGKRENLTQPNRADSAFAQPVQGGALNANASAASVLASADFDCANRKAAGDDAWNWMTGVAQENMSVGKPKNDNDFSKVLAGH